MAEDPKPPDPPGDPIKALTPEDRAWLIEHGWDPNPWPNPRLIGWEYR